MKTIAKTPEPSTAGDQGSVILARFERSDGELWVSWKKFKGQQYLDARIYFRASGGAWAPTKRGVTFRADGLAELASAIAKAQRLASEASAADD